MSAAKRVTVTIDGRTIAVDEGTSILQAASLAGIDIPHFCYHRGLEVEGSCRMCLVEIEGLPKLELSCSNPARDGQVIRTATERVVKARRDVLEFLLAEHPLDCPICDKAGECRLQDYYDAHGRFASAMSEPRDRRAKKVPIGRGLLLDRERCVLCTRCVRFLRQFTRTGELGVFERGLRSEIGFSEGRPVDNLYSGNLVDICPVGAITAEDFRFKTRAWFLTKRPSVCPRCARGCAIVVESISGYPLSKGERRVYRITAGENPAVNGFWICDLGREGRREIDEGRATSLLKSGEPLAAAWPQAVAEIAEKIGDIPGAERPGRMAVVLNSRLTCEELAQARALFVQGLGLDRIYFADPKPGAGDSLLLTAERAPNGRGVLEAGFSPRLPGLHELASSKVALIFGTGLAEHFPEEALAGALAEIPFKAIFTTHSAAPLDRLADLVVPVTLTAERSGTYVNIDGVRQSFAAAVAPPPGAVSEGRILSGLAQALGLDLGVPDGR